MPLPKYAAKRDINEPEIVEALRRIGCSVELVSSSGIPDLLVGFDGINLLMEVKGKDGKLTPPQEDFHRDWLGQKAIVYTSEEALAIVLEYFNA